MNYELLEALENDVLQKRVQTGPLEQRVDHERLAQSLTNVSHPEHYVEVVLKDRNLLSAFPSSLFHAVRVILGTDSYTLARVYPGNEQMTTEQADFLEKLYFDDQDFVDYTKVPNLEEDNAS